LHLVVLLGTASIAQAANFQVLPLRLSFAPDQRALSLSLSNIDIQPVVIEARAFLWEQIDGVDTLTPTTDLVITPPLAEVPANGRQLIRVGRRATVKAGPIERSYRVMLQEVVPTTESARSGLRFSLRLSLPVFITPKLEDDVLARATPEWSATPGPMGELEVALRNSGTAHLQVAGFEVAGADDEPPAQQSSMTYVLAGQTRRYLLKPTGPLPVAGTLLTIKASTDAGDQVARVAFAQP
jgi:fimbrial chaperone protein